MSLCTPGTVAPSPVELFAVADAHGAGTRLREGASYVRVRSGVYAPRAAWDLLAPWDRYLARVHAFALSHPGAIFSHESAAALLGLPIFGEPRDIHVHEPGRERSRRFGDVCVHTSRDLRLVSAHGFVFATSPAQTAVDLMRALPPAFGLAVADAAISPVQGGSLHLENLRTIAESESDRRGRARLAMLWTMIDSRSESVGESVSRAVIHWAGFEEPELQVEVTSEGFTDRVDFAWPGVSVLGESDGYEKYRGATADDTVQRMVKEKQREDRLRRRCRAFTRWDWAAAVSVTRLTERLDAVGVPRVRAAQRALLATVGPNPRSLPTRHHFRTETSRDA